MTDLPPPQPAAETIVVHSVTVSAGAEAFGALALDATDLSPVSGRVEDALRQIGGVQLFRATSTRTSNPTADGITARNLSGNAASRILVTLDGVPLSDPFFGFVAWANLAGRPIERGELIRGGGLGGSGALAGTLALETAQAANRASVRYGSRDSLEGTASLALPVEKGSFGLFGGFRRGDGHMLVANPGPGDAPSAYRQWAVGGRGSVESGPWTVDGGISAFDDNRMRGVVGADITASGGDANIRARSSGPWRTNIALFAQIRDFSTVNRTVDVTRTITTTNLHQRKTPASGWGARISIEPPLGDTVALGIGGEYRTAEGRTVELFRYRNGAPTRHRVAGGSQETGGLFFNGSWRPTPGLLLTAAGRVDWWQIGEGSLEERDIATSNITMAVPGNPRSSTQGSGRLGLLYRPVPAVSLRVAGYRGWRLPTLNELYRPFRAGASATAANADLRPERLWGTEASIAYEPIEAVRLSATWFYNWLDDPIANVTLAQGPGLFPGVGFVSGAGFYRQRRNLEQVRSQGLELDAKLRLRNSYVTASAAFVDAEVRGGGLDGFRPSQAPRYSASLTAGHRLYGADVSVTLRYLGKRYEDDRNARPLPAATTVDAAVLLPLNDKVSLELAGENLTDTDVATGYSRTEFELGQPRTIWAGLRFRY